MTPKVMIVAGEPSGDLHASQVAHQLKARCPDITLFGMGGDRMEKASVQPRLSYPRLRCYGIRGCYYCPADVPSETGVPETAYP